METDTVGSDKGIGYAALFSVLAGLGAAVMLGAGLAHLQLTAAWGFALAMVAATLAVVFTQVYW
jgi:uncharacterized protein related to proFAR isomerase